MTIKHNPTAQTSRLTRHLARAIPAVVVTSAALLTPHAADAAQPTKDGCPKHSWVLSDPAEWLSATKAGIIAEGSTFEEQQALFGFATSAEFEAWIIDGVFGAEAGLDADRDGFVCRSTNTPNGYPEFFFQVHDNKYQPK